MIRPLNGNVLLKRSIVETKTASGIILSADAKEEENIAKRYRGKVVMENKNYH